MVIGANYVHIPKTRLKFSQKYPICGEMLRFGIEPEIIEKAEFYPFPHIILHGSPLHAIIAYVDAELKVRAIESSPSIEILREGATFNSLLQKWSNPF
ncbi:MAG: hypothetical protein ACTSRK_07335 [Promethearchaeota archaeon]